MDFKEGDVVKHILDNEECGRMVVLRADTYGRNEAFCRLVKNGSFVIEVFGNDELKLSDNEDDQVSKLRKELEETQGSKESYERWYEMEQKKTKELKEQLEEVEKQKNKPFPDGL